MATSSQPAGESSSTAQNSDSNQLGPSTSVQFEERSSQPDASKRDGAKKKRHRGGKKRRARRQSFAAPSETGTDVPDLEVRRPTPLVSPGNTGARSSFFNIAQGMRSNTSLESEALMDHRYAVLSANCCCVRASELRPSPTQRSNPSTDAASEHTASSSRQPESNLKSPAISHTGDSGSRQ